MRLTLRSHFTAHDLRRDYDRARMIASRQLNNNTTRRMKAVA